MAYLKCSQCHHQNEGGAKFCDSCGALLWIEPKLEAQPEEILVERPREKRPVEFLPIVAASFLLVLFIIFIYLRSQETIATPSQYDSATPLTSPAPSTIDRASGNVPPSAPLPVEPRTNAQPRYDPSNPAKNPVEYQLAYLDSNGYVAADDPKIRRILSLLESISKKTGDTKEHIADRTGRATSVALQKYGKVITNLQFLEEAKTLVQQSSVKMNYDDASALLLLQMVQ